MANLKGKRVLITGSGKGIGRCLALNFAKEKCELILTDIDDVGLKRVADEVIQNGASAHTYIVDVANRDSVEKMVAKIIDTLGGIDILINNAGIGHNGELVETPISTWKKLVDINFWGPLYHIYAFLPSMIESKSGHIVNISSGQAFFRLPTWGPYAIIKLAIGAFSELLRIELKKFNIKVTTVYPFMVNTGFYNNIPGETWGSKLSMKLVPYYSMTPEKVANIIFKAVKSQKGVEMVSFLNDIAFYSRFITPISNLISSTALIFLGKNSETLRKECEHVWRKECEYLMKEK
ncbi:MAG: SDR family NAD(P)-dependent oxidoreductase [Desulfobacterales bacterium]|nr:SDR family NAD(P)-dependent oxidoreductase [Desulfobacterales bacterium]MBF0395347.1 SDR family NAD(P)-dependent oxidoreductase [Desulfobacterales bacterium]